MQGAISPSQSQEEAHELMLCYSALRMAKIANREWWRHLSGNQQPLWIALPCIVLLFFKAPHPALNILRESLLARGFWLGVLSLSIFQLAQSYFLSLHRWLAWSNREVRYRFDESGVQLHCAGQTSNQGWKTCFCLWRRDDFWVVYPNNGTPFMLPTEELSAELKLFLVRKIEENEGRII